MSEFSPNSLISWLITALVFMGLAHVALYALSIYLRFQQRTRESGEPRPDQLVQSLATDLSSAIGAVWTFARPIMQLIIIAFVIYWFGKTIGFDAQFTSNLAAVDVKTVLAFSVVGAFCVAAFLSENPALVLKDLALVVIGFYFGTKVVS